MRRASPSIHATWVHPQLLGGGGEPYALNSKRISSICSILVAISEVRRYAGYVRFIDFSLYTSRMLGLTYCASWPPSLTGYMRKSPEPMKWTERIDTRLWGASIMHALADPRTLRSHFVALSMPTRGVRDIDRMPRQVYGLISSHCIGASHLECRVAMLLAVYSAMACSFPAVNTRGGAHWVRVQDVRIHEKRAELNFCKASHLLALDSTS